MPDIAITDSLSLTVNLKVNDTAALAKAGFKDIVSHTDPFVAELNKPLDHSGFKTATFGAKFSSPSALIANATNLVIKEGVSGVLSAFRPADKKLFGDDFTPGIPIAADECWMSLEIDTSLTGAISFTNVDGIGVAVEGTTAANFATYTLFKAQDGKFPALKDALAVVLNNYSVDYNVAAVRSQPVGTVRVNDLGGGIKFSGSYGVPISVNPLASADLAFNQQIAVTPTATLQLAGEIQLTGEFVVRSHRVSGNELHLDVCKKKGSSFKATFTAGAGVAATAAGKDLLSTFFGAVFKTPDLSKIGITGDDANTLNAAIKDCVNHSLTVSLNEICSAAFADETAVAYSVNLAGGDPGKTDAAIASALRGDWSALAALPNVTLQRDIVGETQKLEHKLVINLLGI